MKAERSALYLLIALDDGLRLEERIESLDGIKRPDLVAISVSDHLPWPLRVEAFTRTHYQLRNHLADKGLAERMTARLGYVEAEQQLRVQLARRAQFRAGRVVEF